MKLFEVPTEHSEMFFRALKTIALADGAFKDKERALLSAAAEFYSTPVDLDGLLPATATEVAQQVEGRDARERLLQAALVVALADGEASPSEWEVLDDFRRALDIEDENLSVFYDLSLGHFRAARAEILRRTHASELKEVYAREGWLGLLEFMRDGGKQPAEDEEVSDPDRLWRHRKLGLLPEGTLGRSTWQFCVENELSFPGESGGLGEARRDFVRVLLGLDASAHDQLTLAAFLSGNTGEDPFGQLFLALLQFHAGIKVTPGALPTKGMLEPREVIAALAAGQAVPTDLIRGWDPWQDVGKPLVDVRRRLGIAIGGLALATGDDTVAQGP